MFLSYCQFIIILYGGLTSYCFSCLEVIANNLFSFTVYIMYFHFRLFFIINLHFIISYLVFTCHNSIRLIFYCYTSLYGMTRVHVIELQFNSPYFMIISTSYFPSTRLKYSVFFSFLFFFCIAFYRFYLDFRPCSDTFNLCYIFYLLLLSFILLPFD